MYYVDARRPRYQLRIWPLLPYIDLELMCKSCNTVKVQAEHISWNGDAHTIKFAHTKTKIVGAWCEKEHHLYANAGCPEICPIFSSNVSEDRSNSDGTVKYTTQPWKTKKSNDLKRQKARRNLLSNLDFLCQ